MTAGHARAHPLLTEKYLLRSCSDPEQILPKSDRPDVWFLSHLTQSDKSVLACIFAMLFPVNIYGDILTSQGTHSSPYLVTHGLELLSCVSVMSMFGRSCRNSPLVLVCLLFRPSLSRRIPIGEIQIPKALEGLSPRLKKSTRCTKARPPLPGLPFMTEANSEDVTLKPSLIHGKWPVPIILVVSDSYYRLSQQVFF